MEKQDEIKAIAYQMWEEEGCPYGKDLEHYYRAETMYQQQQSQPGETADSPAPNAGREEAEAHERHGQRTGHRRRRGEHHHRDRGEE